MEILARLESDEGGHVGAEDRERVSAAIARGLRMLAPTPQDLNVELMDTDAGVLTAAGWPHLPELRVLEVAHAPAGFLRAVLLSAPEVTHVRISHDGDGFSTAEVGTWEGWPTGMTNLTIDYAQGIARTLRPVRQLQRLCVSLSAGCEAAGAVSNMPDCLTDLTMCLWSNTDAITISGLLALALANPRRLPDLAYLRIVVAGWITGRDDEEIAATVESALEAACAARAVHLVLVKAAVQPEDEADEEADAAAAA